MTMQRLGSFPPELLLPIFSYLDYSDLKLRVPLVCRKFHNLLQKASPTSASKIDEILFRDAPRHRAGKTAVTLHHELVNLDWSYTTDVNDVSLKRGEDKEEKNEESRKKIKLVDTPLARENISSPSAKTAVYHMTTMDGPDPDLKITGTGDGGAVTILDVMSAVALDGVKTSWEKIKWAIMEWDGVEKAEIVENVLHLYDEFHLDDSYRM